jgi:hypothetical protein
MEESQKIEPGDTEDDHKLSITIVLMAIEFIGTTYGDEESRRLTLRELTGQPDTMLERFSALMIHYETKFNQIKVEQQVEPKYQNMIDPVFKSWKEHGFSAFNQDVVSILFDKDMTPVFIEDPRSKEMLHLLIKAFKK